MLTVEFTRTFAAAHRVWNDPGKCRNVHGHNYRASIRVTHDVVGEQNFVVPFDAVKTIVDRFDHTLILDLLDPLLGQFKSLDLALSIVEGVPSTERLAEIIASEIAAEIPPGGYVVVHLRETDGICAKAEAIS